MKKYADQNRRHLEFDVGDKVMLSAKDIKINPAITSYKLNEKYLGPFKVIERIGELDYKLELPKSMSRVHPTFHVSKLREFVESDPRFGDRDFGTDPVMNDDGEEEWEIEKIVDESDEPKHLYRIRWKGWDSKHDTWEDPKVVEKYRNLVEQWKKDRQILQDVIDKCAKASTKRNTKRKKLRRVR